MLIKSRFNENHIGAIFVPGGRRFVFVEMKDKLHRVSKLSGHAIESRNSWGTPLLSASSPRPWPRQSRRRNTLISKRHSYGRTDVEVWKIFFSGKQEIRIIKNTDKCQGNPQKQLNRNKTRKAPPHLNTISKALGDGGTKSFHLTANRI